MTELSQAYLSSATEARTNVRTLRIGTETLPVLRVCRLTDLIGDNSQRGKSGVKSKYLTFKTRGYFFGSRCAGIACQATACHLLSRFTNVPISFAPANPCCGQPESSSLLRSCSLFSVLFNLCLHENHRFLRSDLSYDRGCRVFRCRSRLFPCADYPRTAQSAGRLRG
jgi:hypothetical protein